MIKHVTRALVIIFVTLFIVPVVVSAQSSSLQNFTISSFQADYYLSKNSQNVSQMQVTETIVADFPDYDQNHGIIRALPETYNNVSLGLKIESVLNTTSGSTAYATSKQNHNLVLKIGDASSYVKGTQTYIIKYLVKNVITVYDNQQELFWNVNGTQWQQPILKASAIMHMTDSVSNSLLTEEACVTGLSGSKEHNCEIAQTISPNNSGKIVNTSTTQGLAKGENLSFVIAFKTDTFAIDKKAQLLAKAKKYTPFIFATLVPVVFFGLLINRWFKIGRDAKGTGLIIPQYVPLKELNVLQADTLLHEATTQKSVSALIIELAVKKYLTLIETAKDQKLLGIKLGSNKDYSVRLEKDISVLVSSEQSVLKMIFGSNPSVGDLVEMASLKDKAYKEIAKISKDVPLELYESGYFRNNPKKLVGLIAKNSFAILAVLGILFVGLIFSGLIEWPTQGVPILILAGITMVISGIISTKILPSKTLQGTTAKEYLLGLKEYIKLAEAERLKYLQSPEGAEKYGDIKTNSAKIKLFEKLLPYAIIFGLEKEWAKSFANIYEQPPDWYQGNWSAFNTGVLLGSINSFDSASNVSFSAPSSSGGSGFGGGSGGGGGGGGGGGW